MHCFTHLNKQLPKRRRASKLLAAHAAGYTKLAHEVWPAADTAFEVVDVTWAVLEGHHWQVRCRFVFCFYWTT